MYLWNNVKALGLKYLCPRDLNQDPLENFFGLIRSHGARNIFPTCFSFIQSFKTMIINNFLSSHSISSNCEEDSSEGALSLLKEFVIEGKKSFSPKSPVNPVIDVKVKDIPESSFISTFLQLETHKFIAGYIVRKILRKIKYCDTCKNEISLPRQNFNDLISTLDYGSHVWGLKRPSPKFRQLFSSSCRIVHFILPKYCLKSGISEIIKTAISRLLKNEYVFDKCPLHNIFDLFLDFFPKILIFQWAKLLNLILKGKQSKGLNDNVKIIARNKYLRCKAKRAKLRGIKKLKE